MKVKAPAKVENLYVPIFKSGGRFNEFYNLNFERCVEVFREKEMNFEVHENFNCKKIVWERNGKIRRRKFVFQFTHQSIFAMAGYVRRNIESKIVDINKIHILNNFKFAQRYVYKEKNSLTAYQYDLRNAYTSILRSFPLLDADVYAKLIEFKTKGQNINKILGMAILGSTTIREFMKGKQRSIMMADENSDLFGRDRKKKEKPNAIYNMASYICNASISKVCEMFGENVIARYSDSFILNKKIDIDFLREKFIEAELEVISRMNKNILKYHGIYLHDLFTPVCFEDTDTLSGTYDFHEQKIESVIYSYDQYNRRELSFYRETKEKDKIEKIVYKTNEEKLTLC